MNVFVFVLVIACWKGVDVNLVLGNFRQQGRGGLRGVNVCMCVYVSVCVCL
jgi:hypothetical protein